VASHPKLFSENFSANRNQRKKTNKRKDFERKNFWQKAQAAKFFTPTRL
jgi:hypothetical protein